MENVQLLDFERICNFFEEHMGWPSMLDSQVFLVKIAKEQL